MATVEVTTVSDAGVGSLRQAILDANNPALTVDEVTFDISGAGRHVISPLTDLPDITEPVTVDGDGNTIVGNYIGLTAGGDRAGGNEGRGVNVAGDGNVIGGSTPADRNLITDNSKEGVMVRGTPTRCRATTSAPMTPVAMASATPGMEWT